jgi:hypothetical protein
VSEGASTELEKALDEALKAAAEEGAVTAAEEKAEAVSERFSEVQGSEGESEGRAPESAPEDNGTEFEQHLESIPESAEPGEVGSVDVEASGLTAEETVEHTGNTEQSAPQTAVEEAPVPPAESELPERLNVADTPVAETDESGMKKPEISESGSGDEI